MVNHHQLCFNCLSAEHTAVSCPSGHRCHECGKGHHTLIRQYESEIRLQQPSISAQAKPHDSSQALTQINSLATYCTVKLRPQSQVLLATAQVVVCDNRGELHKCRALLDSASQNNFIAESLVQRLCLKKRSNRLPIQGINEVT
jgi:NMD protein affecting ribosome stability and mRNA decay